MIDCNCGVLGDKGSCMFFTIHKYLIGFYAVEDELMGMRCVLCAHACLGGTTSGPDCLMLT